MGKTRNTIRGVLANCARQLLEKPLYSIGIHAYASGVRVASISNPKAGKMIDGHKEIWKRLKEKITPGERYVWLHAASLGEFEQGRTLIDTLHRERPDLKVIVTFFSPSGYEVRKDYPGAHCVVYLPFDTPRNVKRFLDIVNPEMAIFVKYEFWRNFLHELKKREIPTYLISAVFRPDQPFFRKASAWYGHWLRCYTKIYVQDFRSRSLLEKVGIRNVEVAGDTRFDRVAEICRQCRKIPVVERFVTKSGSDPADSHRMVLIAGSSWEADEKIYSGWVKKHPEVKLILAPHEFDSERLKRLIALFGRENTVLKSECDKDETGIAGKQVLIIDCFGLLSSIYQYGDVAYIGGGFGEGIHNINEAAVYDIPVMFGPNNSKFIEAQELKTLGGGIEIQSEESFRRNADRLLHDELDRRQRGKWAGDYIREKIGATARIYSELFCNKD